MGWKYGWISEQYDKISVQDDLVVVLKWNGKDSPSCSHDEIVRLEYGDFI